MSSITRLGRKVRQRHTAQQDNPKERYEVLLRVQHHLGPRRESLYNATSQIIRKLVGRSVIARYNDKTVDFIVSNFPDHAWQVWKFTMAQPHHWFTQVAHGVEQHDPVRLTAAAQYVEYLASKYSVACFDDWHRVILDSTEQQRVSKFGGLFNLLSRVYPIHKFRAFSGSTSIAVPSAHGVEWNDINAVRQYLLEIVKRNNNSVEALYRLTKRLLVSVGGRGAFTGRVNTICDLVTSALPELNLKPWRFIDAPNLSISERDILIDIVADNGGNLEYLYNLTRTQLLKLTNNKIPRDCDTIADLAIKTFPSHKWKLWLFADKPSSIWSREDVVKEFMEDLRTKLGGSLDAFYLEGNEAFFAKHGGRQLLAQYGGYASVAVMLNWPTHPWEIHKFKRMPPPDWELRWGSGKKIIARNLLINCAGDLDKLYAVTAKDFDGLGAMWLQINGGCPSSAVMALFPDHKWIPWKFAVTPRGLWLDPKNRRAFLDTLCVSHDQLYKLTSQQVINAGGGILLKYYGSSVINLVVAEYPEHAWSYWNFERSPRGWWDELVQRFCTKTTSSNPVHQLRAVDPIAETVVRLFIDYIADQHKVQKLDDWYRVSSEQLQAGIYDQLGRLGRLPTVLARLFPYHEWQLSQFDSSSKKAAQRFVKLSLSTVFSDYDIIEEATPQDLKFKYLPSDNILAKIRFDISIPELRLVFEYHGPHHYYRTYLYNDPSDYKFRDAHKKQICEKNGFTLIQVPFWWDKRLDSLLNTIHEARPDIVPFPVGDGTSIPLHPPADYKDNIATK